MLCLYTEYLSAIIMGETIKKIKTGLKVATMGRLKKASDSDYMRLAGELAEQNIDKGGGPFAALIVKDGKIIATGLNTVTLSNDPTAHAEINAIRRACKKLKTFLLEDCIVYSSCEPCPMCLSALYWAHVKKIYYGNTQEDAAAIDFSDNFIYKELEKAKMERLIPCIRISNEHTIRAFEKWAAKEDKVKY